jgi:hypothetical protein
MATITSKGQVTVPKKSPRCTEIGELFELIVLCSHEIRAVIDPISRRCHCLLLSRRQLGAP